jgi:hypothetical protein
MLHRDALGFRVHFPVHHNVKGSCAIGHKPAVALCAVVIGYNDTTMPRQLWLAIANRKAYAEEHGYPHYLVVQPLGSGRHPCWEKLIAVRAIMHHSCAEWVWMLDTDAFIMNLQLDVLAVALNPLANKHSDASCSTNSPDVIAAGGCETPLNGGSVLFRNNNWTHQLLGEVWHSEPIVKPRLWREQAGLLHMFKQPDKRQHFCIVRARMLNASPNDQDCHDGHGTYKVGYTGHGTTQQIEECAEKQADKQVATM